MAKTAHSDDLTLIKGVGPKAAAALGEARIGTFQAVASASADVLSEAVRGKSAQQIVDEDWKGQAAALAAAWPASRTRRHTFTLTMEVDTATQQPVRYDITHIPTKDSNHEPDGETMSGRDWDPEGVLGFITSHASLTAGILNEQPLEMSSEAPSPGGPWLHTFDLIEVDAPRVRRPRSFRLVLECDPSGMGLRPQHPTELHVTALAVPRPIGKSVRIGDRTAPITHGTVLELDIDCRLAAGSAPTAIMALVEILVHGGDADPPVHGLPDGALRVTLVEEAGAPAAGLEAH